MSRCIDADALLKAIIQMPPNGDVFDQIHEAPTIEPERKTGWWIEVEDSDNSISGKCSECGWEAHMYEDDVFGMDYCPNCGTRLLIK